MKRAIVTGATGFVGANLARRLLADGHEVHLLARPNRSRWRIEEITDEVRIHEVSIEDAEGVERAVRAIRPDWVFHLAAYGGYSWQNDAWRMVRTNIHGTLALLWACLATGFEAFVNTGSSSEYGFKDHAPAEDEALDPNSHYAVTKAAATMFCRHAAASHRVHLPTLRLYSVFGPFEDPGRLLPTLLMHGARGTLPPLVSPEVARDFVFVDDVCDAYVLAARTRTAEWGPGYNVGTGVQSTVRDAVDAARRLMSIAAEPSWSSMPNYTWDSNVWVADNRKIRSVLGWQPKYTFETGFRRMHDWFRAAQPDCYRLAPLPERRDE
jgi:UDP-glucose 4-epimerase